jgi:hypothetical protein
MSAMKEAFVLEQVQQSDHALARRQPLVPVFNGMSARLCHAPDRDQ